jgi:hypothetical protein
MAESDNLPRLVVGASFRQLLPIEWRRLKVPPRLPQPLHWQPRCRDSSTGVRLATDPEGLLRSLLAYSGPLSPSVAAALARFLRAPAHREVLRPAWHRALRRAPSASRLRPELEAGLFGG